MTQDQKNKVALTISYVAEYYSKEISKPVIAMMSEDLSDLDFESVMKAYESYRRNDKNVFFPLPAQIRAIVNPKQSKDGMANEAAARIRQAVSKFGWCNPVEARTFIGELGWAAVERAGGWPYICENHGVDLNPLTFHAQTRDVIKGLIESSELGIYDQPIALPEAKNKPQIENILKLTGIKEMPKG